MDNKHKIINNTVHNQETDNSDDTWTANEQLCEYVDNTWVIITIGEQHTAIGMVRGGDKHATFLF